MSWRLLPNAICVVRMLLVAPLVWLITEHRYAEALALFVVAGASDGLDGYLAKKFDWRTRLGGLLDPAADKLLLVCVFGALTFVGLVPLALTVMVIGRDVVIVLGAVGYQLFVARVQGEPAVISKLNTGCQLAYVVVTLAEVVFEWPSAEAVIVLGAVAVFTTLVSGLHYVLQWSVRARRVAHGGA